MQLDPSSWDLADLGSLTYVLAGAMAFLEVGTPIGIVAPSELAVPIAGAAAAAGAVGLGPLILVVWLAAVVGDTTGFVTGRLAGARVEARLLRRGGRLACHHASMVRHFERHGVLTVFLGRWVPYARSAASPFAGASGMSYRTFLLTSVVGAALWSASMCTVGYVFYDSAAAVAGSIAKGAVVVAALLVITGVSVAVVRNRRALRSEGGADLPDGVTTAEDGGSGRLGDALALDDHA